MRIQYISDDVKPGAHGGELNDHELLKTLREDFYSNPSKSKQQRILKKYGLYFKLP